jgi:hypothetical protein
VTQKVKNISFEPVESHFSRVLAKPDFPKGVFPNYTKFSSIGKLAKESDHLITSTEGLHNNTSPSFICVAKAKARNYLGGKSIDRRNYFVPNHRA